MENIFGHLNANCNEANEYGIAYLLLERNPDLTNFEVCFLSTLVYLSAKQIGLGTEGNSTKRILARSIEHIESMDKQTLWNVTRLMVPGVCHTQVRNTENPEPSVAHRDIFNSIEELADDLFNPAIQSKKDYVGIVNGINWGGELIKVDVQNVFIGSFGQVKVVIKMTTEITGIGNMDCTYKTDKNAPGCEYERSSMIDKTDFTKFITELFSYNSVSQRHKCEDLSKSFDDRQGDYKYTVNAINLLANDIFAKKFIPHYSGRSSTTGYEWTAAVEQLDSCVRISCKTGPVTATLKVYLIGTTEEFRVVIEYAFFNGDVIKKDTQVNLDSQKLFKILYGLLSEGKYTPINSGK